MRIAFISAFLLFFLCYKVAGQPVMEPVKGLATKEVYDLLLDKRGFVWVGHELGLSRINNGSFENFSHPQQASLSVTNLLEDNQGRIWCHNFSGQIFYVEHNRMHLLNAYKSAEEQGFPNMVILGNELVVTSRKGLFICNLLNLSCHYILFNFDPKGISIAVVDKQVIVYDGSGWYAYRHATGIHKLSFTSHAYAESSFFLKSDPSKDTLYLAHNPEGLIQKALCRNGAIQILEQRSFHSFINNLSFDKNEVWVHTQLGSLELNGLENPIEGRDLTDVLTDKEGNRWWSSLNIGLRVVGKSPPWKRFKSFPDVNNIIRSIVRCNNRILCGTQTGDLIYIDPRNPDGLAEFQKSFKTGSIENLRQFGPDLYVGSTGETYLIDTLHPNQKQVLLSQVFKDLDRFDSNLLFATPNTLIIRPLNKKLNIHNWLNEYLKRYPSFTNNFVELTITGRCKAARVESNGVIAAALISGLVEIDSLGTHPVLYQNLPVYANSLEKFADRLFIATPGNGILVRSGRSTRSLNGLSGGLLSNSIIRIKRLGTHLWVLEDQYLQVYDLITNKFISTIDLPPVGGVEVFDIAELGDSAYISSKDGMYAVAINAVKEPAPDCYLDKILINEKDTIFSEEDPKLSYSKNNLKFFLATSWYDHSNGAKFRFRLSQNEKDWQSLSPGNNEVQFTSLTPGNYIFQAFAEADNGKRSPVISFPFTIAKPWWQQWWFWLLTALFLLSVVYAVYQYRLQQVMKIDKMRRKLSSDLHDNIGATLSCVNMYAEMAKEEGVDEYAGLIQSLSNEAIQQLRDMVWSINPKNDSYEQLINRMHSFAATFFKAAGVTYTLTYDEALYEYPLDLNKRQNLYFIFKELVNNVIRHAQATSCSIGITCNNDQIGLSVKDNGKGFVPENRSVSGNGISNILDRVKEMKGKVRVDSKPGQGSLVFISVPV